MSRQDTLRLLLLSAIWGASFIFIRLLAPVLGPVVTVEARLFIAGAILLGYFALIRLDVQWRLYWRHYLVLGLLNSGIPFLLFAFAALHMPAGYSAILNAATPMFGAILGVYVLREALTRRKVLGLCMGALGVVLIVQVGAVQYSLWFFLAALACIMGTFCYALAAVYLQKYAKHLNPLAVAGATQWSIGLLFLPLALAFPPRMAVTWAATAHLLALAVLCSVVAYVMFYRLTATIGTRVLTVTYLIPMFAMIWAWLFLGEPMTWVMLAGGALIMLGTALIVVQSRANVTT